jgi:hypothetical protein
VHGGVEVHAGVVIEAGDVRGREHLSRYAARPGVCLDRLSQEDEGRVQIRFKRLWSNGTPGGTLELAVFLLRLASLLLPGGVNVVHYHGGFAPAVLGREHIVRAAGPPGREVHRSRWRRRVPWGKRTRDLQEPDGTPLDVGSTRRAALPPSQDAPPPAAERRRKASNPTARTGARRTPRSRRALRG